MALFSLLSKSAFVKMHRQNFAFSDEDEARDEENPSAQESAMVLRGSFLSFSNESVIHHASCLS